MSLISLFSPQSVVVLGASERAGHGRSVLESLISTGYSGKLAVVNPKYTGSSVLGIPCFGSVDELPFVPECLISAVRPELTNRAVRDAAALGTRAAVILSSGFSESGLEGRELQQELEDVADLHQLAICGPNCMGIANYVDNFHPFAETPPTQSGSYKANVAVVAQSGSISRLFLHSKRLNAAYIVSAGNQATTTFAEYIRFFISTGHIRTIVLVIESIRDTADFFAAVREAVLHGIAVAAVRTGASKSGAEALISHTGKMAGDFETFVQECRRNGIVFCDSLDELFETAVALAGYDGKSADGLCLVNSSGGENAHILDLAARHGLIWAGFTADTKSSLEALLPAFATVSNPLDVTGKLLFEPESYRAAIRAICTDSAVSSLAMIPELPWPGSTGASDPYDPFFAHTWRSAIDITQASAIPLIVCLPIGAQLAEPFHRELIDAGVVILTGLNQAIMALRNVQISRRSIATVTEWLCLGKAVDEEVERDDIEDYLRELGKSLGTSCKLVLREVEALQLMQHGGIPVAPYALLSRDFWQRPCELGLQFPIVVKADARSLAHKSDVGGVVLGVQTMEELVGACKQILLNLKEHDIPESDIAGFIAAEMITDAVELIVGARFDSELGPIVTVGIGGIFTEILNSSASAIAPLSVSQAELLISKLRGVELLKGARGGKARDVRSAAEIVAKVSQIVSALGPALVELDLNPVLVKTDNEGAFVCDALAVVDYEPRREVSI